MGTYLEANHRQGFERMWSFLWKDRAAFERLLGLHKKVGIKTCAKAAREVCKSIRNARLGTLAMLCP